MKILVIGATGLIGKKVTAQLTDLGHNVIAGSSTSGINVVTGEGLQNALRGADIVIDLSSPRSSDGDAVLDFFKTAGNTLVAAEKEAYVKHHIVLSIVGTDKVPHIRNLRAKKEQEDIIKRSGIPYTIIRSTQFYELVDTIIAVQSKNEEVHVSTMPFQPIASKDVATFVAQVALEPALNETVEIAGPERAHMNEFVERYLTIKNDGPKRVITNNDNLYMCYKVPRSTLVPEGNFRAGTILFDDWARQ